MWKSIVTDSLAHRLSTVTWILPQSVSRPVTFSQGQYRPSWFDIARLPPDKDEYDQVSIAASVSVIEDLILAQVHAGIDSRRIILVGFSQGAALSLMTALTSLHDLGGVVSLSGWIPHKARPFMNHADSIPILWCHGDVDDEIPLECGQEAAHFLVALNQVVRFKTYEGLSHSINAEEIDDLGTWLEGTLANWMLRLLSLPLSRTARKPTQRNMSRITIPTEMKIELNPAELQLCDLLTKFTTSHNLSTTCRIAGGWVRDKLLGLQSNDIDIALSDMMGQPFADAFKEFTQNEGIDSSKVGVVKKNAEQSKHLEPATLRILSHDIDFVNLRSEEYTSESRIPSTIRFGTPLEDALRRDITINSLFYNIHTSVVEDFTGKGLEDLRNGIIRTPLSPRETFNDDPLRVLRCIRFAGRFGFQLESDIKDAAKDPQIQKALISKVKRDRIGEEISKMLKSRDPFGSICLIHELGLYNSIFTFIPPDVVETFSPPLHPTVRSLTSAYLLQTLLHPNLSSSLPPVHPTLLTAVNADPSCTARLFLAASLSPFLGVTYEDRKKKTSSAVTYSLRESLKLGDQHHFLNGVQALFTASELLNNPDLRRFQNKSERVAIGMLLRNKSVHYSYTGSHWTSSLLFALVRELVPYCNPETKEIQDQAATVIETYNTFVKKVEELGLSHVSDAKTLLDGRDVNQILNAKAGPWTGHVLSQVMEWQLEHPEGTKEECVEWLKLAYSSASDPVSEPVTKKARIE